MIKRLNYIPFLLLIMLTQLSSKQLAAQVNKQMFMFQVDGNNYTKKSYNNKNELISSQIFKVGEIKNEEGLRTMKLKVYSYDKNNKLKDSAEIKYTCKPSVGEIFMNVIPFAEYSVNKIVKIELGSNDTFYPTTWQIGKEMDDISFSLSLEGGVLGTFGSSSKNRIYDRKITAYDTLKNTYTITSNIEIKTYMFGLRMDTIEYTLEETIHPQKGIVKQYFKESTGEYFIIKLNNK